MENASSLDLKTLLNEAFAYFDEDNDGHIDFEQMVLLFSDLGEDATHSEIQDFFDYVDENHDGLITFDQLYTWFVIKSKEDSSSISLIRLRVINFINRIREQEKSSSVSVKTQEDENFDTHSANIIVGDPFEAKTRIGVKIYTGEEADTEFSSLSEGLKFENNCGLVICIKAHNPQRAKESLESFLRRFIDWGNNMLPKDSGIDLKQVKEQIIFDDNVIKIGLEPQHESIVELIEQYVKSQSLIIPDGFTGIGALEINLKKDFKGVLEEEADTSNQQNQLMSKKNLLHHIFEGISAKCNVKLTNFILEKLRNTYFKSQNFAKLPKTARNFAFLLLWKRTKIQLNFKKVRGSFLDDVLPEKIDLSIQKLLEDLKGVINPLQKKYAMVKTLLLVANKELIADFTLGVKGPRFMINIEGKTAGIKEIYEQVSK